MTSISQYLSLKASFDGVVEKGSSKFSLPQDVVARSTVTPNMLSEDHSEEDFFNNVSFDTRYVEQRTLRLTDDGKWHYNHVEGTKEFVLDFIRSSLPIESPIDALLIKYENEDGNEILRQWFEVDTTFEDAYSKPFENIAHAILKEEKNGTWTLEISKTKDITQPPSSPRFDIESLATAVKISGMRHANDAITHLNKIAHEKHIRYYELVKIDRVEESEPLINPSKKVVKDKRTSLTYSTNDALTPLAGKSVNVLKPSTKNSLLWLWQQRSNWMPILVVNQTNKKEEYYGQAVGTWRWSFAKPVLLNYADAIKRAKEREGHKLPSWTKTALKTTAVVGIIGIGVAAFTSGDTKEVIQSRINSANMRGHILSSVKGKNRRERASGYGYTPGLLETPIASTGGNQKNPQTLFIDSSAYITCGIDGGALRCSDGSTLSTTAGVVDSFVMLHGKGEVLATWIDGVGKAYARVGNQTAFEVGNSTFPANPYFVSGGRLSNITNIIVIQYDDGTHMLQTITSGAKGALATPALTRTDGLYSKSPVIGHNAGYILGYTQQEQVGFNGDVRLLYNNGTHDIDLGFSHNLTTGYQGDPALARIVSPSGKVFTIVCWNGEDNQPDTNLDEISCISLNEALEFGPEFRANVNTTDFQLRPALSQVSTQTSRILVSWSSNTDSDNSRGIRARFLVVDDTGAISGATDELILVDEPGQQLRSSNAAKSDTDFMVSYVDQASTPDLIRQQRFQDLPPQWTPIPDQNFPFGQNFTLSYGPSVSDDGGTPTVYVSGLPPYATNDPVAMEIRANNVPPLFNTVYNVSLVASDGRFNTTLVVPLQVVNTPPDWIGTISNIIINTGGNFTFDYNSLVSDPDGNPFTVTASGTRNWMTHTPGQSLTGENAPGNFGNVTYRVTLLAFDEFANSTVYSVFITVENTPPIWGGPLVDQILTTGQSFALSYSGLVSDPDGTTPTVTVIDMQPWMLHNPISQEVTGTNAPGNLGRVIDTLQFIASDGFFYIPAPNNVTVEVTNDAPVWSSGLTDVLLQPGQGFSRTYGPLVTDPESQPMTFSATGIQAWMDHLPGDRIEGASAPSSVTDVAFPIIVTASDGFRSTSRNFTIIIQGTGNTDGSNNGSPTDSTDGADGTAGSSSGGSGSGSNTAVTAVSITAGSVTVIAGGYAIYHRTKKRKMAANALEDEATDRKARTQQQALADSTQAAQLANLGKKLDQFMTGEYASGGLPQPTGFGIGDLSTPIVGGDGDIEMAAV